MIMKSLLLFLAALSWLSGLAQTNHVVFVCEHGSAKSVIAAAYFNKLASERKLAWRAVARGTIPDAEISPKTKKLLAEDGLLDNSFVPQLLLQGDVDIADKVYMFTALPENIHDRNNVESWRDINAVNDDFQRLKKDIIDRITPVLDSLAKR
jgi:arsenate reductase (thioredoxin)